jgi:diguanylate cyclase (GGDEF)-like protein
VLERQLAGAASTRGRPAERWMKRKDGSTVWASTGVSAIRDAQGIVRGYSVVISDETEQRRLDDERDQLIAELRDLSMTDELTSLPNRRRWRQELERELARARRQATVLALVMLDLDHFKEFNDTHGHVAGDDLLRRLAAAWSVPLRASDMLARYGGDEFAVMLPNCPADRACAVIERIRAATPEGLGVSAGLTTSDGSDSAEDLILRADAALYEAKERGTGAVLATVADPA